MKSPAQRHGFLTLTGTVVALALHAAFIARGADVPTSDAPAAPITKGQRIFSCGHSFHFQVPTLLEEMAKAGGVTDQVIVGKSLIGGSKSLRHWDVKDESND